MFYQKDKKNICPAGVKAPKRDPEKILMKKGKILISGSVVLDTIYNETPGKESKGEKFFGGTGANIAYGLAGGDFEKDFGPHLKKRGVDLRLHIENKEKTASFTCTVNKDKTEKEIWEPNAYRKINKLSLLKTIKVKELKSVAIAIFSPGTPESILKHLNELKNFAPSTFAIFDPGQMTMHYSKKQFTDCVKLADMLILNELEYGQIKITLGEDPVKFFSNLKKIIIKTKGEKGSVVFQKGKRLKIKAIRPKQMLDTTGAGDAYRAGLIFGLWQGKSTTEACAIGAKVASKCVEYIGCQQYKIENSML